MTKLYLYKMNFYKKAQEGEGGVLPYLGKLILLFLALLAVLAIIIWKAAPVIRNWNPLG
jgi:hypothetical protein